MNILFYDIIFIDFIDFIDFINFINLLNFIDLLNILLLYIFYSLLFSYLELFNRYRLIALNLNLKIKRYN